MNEIDIDFLEILLNDKKIEIVYTGQFYSIKPNFDNEDHEFNQSFSFFYLYPPNWEAKYWRFQVPLGKEFQKLTKEDAERLVKYSSKVDDPAQKIINGNNEVAMKYIREKLENYDTNRKL